MSALMDEQPLFGDPDVDKVIAALQKVAYPTRKGWARWPSDTAADEHFVRELREQYPTVDLVQAVQAWEAWMLDNPPTGRVNWRSRFRTWIRNGLRYDREKRDRAAAARTAPGGAGGRYSGPSTAARPHDAYGDTRRLGDGEW